MPSGGTYSFKDLSGGFADPDVGAFTFAGQIGAGQVTVAMATEKTAQDVASDGAVMVSAIAGDNGSVTIEVQQTSPFHKFLLAWYNFRKTAFMNGDVGNWAASALTLRSVSDGSGHVCTGISPSKIPDKVYTAQGQKLAWILQCADIQSIAA